MNQATEHPTATSPRIARRQQRTRQAILEAAIEQFTLQGFVTVSIEDILESADVSRGTFYKLFKSKEDVLSQILIPLMESLGDQLTAIDAEDPFEIFEKILDTYVDLWRKAPGAFSLASSESPRVFHLLSDSHLPVMTQMRRLFENLQRHGVLRSEDADYAVALLARTAVVVLRIYAGNPAWESLFRDTMRGYLLKNAG